VTVTVKSGEKTPITSRSRQAGIFVARDVPEQDRGPLVGIVCPNILFPYARESDLDLVSRGSFRRCCSRPSTSRLYMQRVAHLREQTRRAKAQPRPTDP